MRRGPRLRADAAPDAVRAALHGPGVDRTVVLGHIELVDTDFLVSPEVLRVLGVVALPAPDALSHCHP